MSYPGYPYYFGYYLTVYGFILEFSNLDSAHVSHSCVDGRETKLCVVRNEIIHLPIIVFARVTENPTVIC